jgi:hypothetical protein
VSPVCSHASSVRSAAKKMLGSPLLEWPDLPDSAGLLELLRFLELLELRVDTLRLSLGAMPDNH